MPAWIRDDLESRGLMQAYGKRPPYQRNDWLAWIKAAKREDTQHRRADSMLRELRAGDRYMGMAWTPGSVKRR